MINKDFIRMKKQ